DRKPELERSVSWGVGWQEDAPSEECGRSNGVTEGPLVSLRDDRLIRGADWLTRDRIGRRHSQPAIRVEVAEICACRRKDGALVEGHGSHGGEKGVRSRGAEGLRAHRVE